MKNVIRTLTVGTAVIFGAALLSAQNNGQYSDPNYNNNQSNQNGQYGQNSQNNNGQYNNGQNNNGQYNNGQYGNGQSNNGQYANGSNGQYDQGPYAQNGNIVPSGAQLHVRTDQTIDVRNGAHAGQIFPATIADDVLDQGGNLAIPRGSRAELRVVNLGSTNNNSSNNNSANNNSANNSNNGNNNELTLDLDSVTVNGHRYRVSSEDTSASGSTRMGGIGANKRTGEYVGGGALVGTLLGALAGGGKGAAIGAIVGGAAGAGTQVLTRGKSLSVPAETVLNFRLDRPVTLRPYTGPNDGRNRLPQ